MDGNAHNIAAWNAYRASALTPAKPQRPAAPQPPIPDWAKWFDPEPVRATPKVIRFLLLCSTRDREDVHYDKISPITTMNKRDINYYDDLVFKKMYINNNKVFSI